MTTFDLGDLEMLLLEEILLEAGTEAICEDDVWLIVGDDMAMTGEGEDWDLFAE